MIDGKEPGQYIHQLIFAVVNDKFNRPQALTQKVKQEEPVMSDDEKVYLGEGDVRVTNARFIVAGQTYVMSGITSVRQKSKSPLLGPIILGLFGLALVASGNRNILGMIMIAGAVFWYFQTKYVVILRTSSGESQAYSSKDEQKIARIVTALNSAIVERG